jgi:hypothetical protein
MAQSPRTPVISGVVTEQDSGKPISDANVYVNGTSVRVVTDANGLFSLTLPAIPCQVVFSHLIYQPVVLEVTQPQTSCQVEMMPRVFELAAVEVRSETNRGKNLEYFKNCFLGVDEWGKQARIQNEEALHFQVILRPETPQNIMEIQEGQYEEAGAETQSDTTEATFLPLYFEASASAPLIVDLPSLGYQVEVDLVQFKVEVNPELSMLVSSFAAYYSYKEIVPTARKERILIRDNRLRAYQNSSMHFFRSMCQGRLPENGYTVSTPTLNKEGANPFYLDKKNSVDRDDITSPSFLLIRGMKGLTAVIRHFVYENGKSVNLNSPEPDSYVSISRLYILSDTCLIRSNGTIPDNSILIKGPIGDKRVGAMLPWNYNPKTDLK